MNKIENIQAVVNQIFESIVLADEKEMKEQLPKVIEQITTVHKDIFNHTEIFDLFGNQRIDKVFRTSVKVLFPHLNSEEVAEFYFIYRDYRSLDSHLSNFLQKREGSMGCSDKSGWLVEQYKHYVLSKKLPDMTRAEGCYWKPKKGTAKDWMDLCHALWVFHLGNPQKYMEVTNRLDVLYNMEKENENEA